MCICKCFCGLVKHDILVCLVVGTEVEEDVDIVYGLDLKNTSGSTALHIACEKGYAGIVQTLLRWGANFGILNKDEWTALILAAEGGKTNCVEKIVSFPNFKRHCQTNLNAQNVFGKGALHMAAERGNFETGE